MSKKEFLNTLSVMLVEEEESVVDKEGNEYKVNRVDEEEDEIYLLDVEGGDERKISSSEFIEKGFRINF